jgi:hypothetical protein
VPFSKTTIMNRPINWPVVTIAIVVATLALVIVPAGNRLSRTEKLQYQSDRQLKSIGILVPSFRTKFHKQPGHLSEIVPSDRTDLQETFYGPNRSKAQRPIDWSRNTLSIDAYSDYAVSAKTNTGILAFEKPGIWKDGTVAVCFTNLSVVRMRGTAFEKLLKQ